MHGKDVQFNSVMSEDENQNKLEVHYKHFLEQMSEAYKNKFKVHSKYIILKITNQDIFHISDFLYIINEW